jgi:NO-binding membrane sensor protein with MHYT domain
MARSRARRLIVALLAILGIVLLSFVGLAAVVGPTKAVQWVSPYLIPMAAILGAVFVILSLLVGMVKRLPKGQDISDWWQ